MLKICVIGSSGHFRYALEGLDEECSITGIAPGVPEEDLSKLEKAISEMNIKPKKYNNWWEMLEKEKPDILVINTVFSLNGKILLEALERKIHAFVEKPIATTFEDLEKIRSVYQKVRNEVFFTAMFGIRYRPHFLTAKKLVSEGAVGEIRLVNTQKSYKLGQRPDFYKKRETYGGTIPWVGIHAIDWIHWITGKKFLSVYATHSRLHNSGHGELETTALCHFTLENEVFASLSIDYLRPQGAPTHDDDRMRIVGTRGIVEVINERVFLTDEKGHREVPLVEKGQIFEDFLREIRGQGKCMVTPEDSILTTEIALKARLSADTGQIVLI
ncbi:oxidoreductase [Thermotoga maritima MSB8]|uniref:Oxidoreductase, putative n=1 Tax=Thermotoga maritima (strain ATCC 43589 / DSM 3109 / JCM 10099 / NBRC 100826 / MSB8) TaxID=243274 RepID=Q9WYQ6_THEMA|nr:MULTISPECIES: Gfo/Idh/MocA family oxidoreductase [Thermotoga]AAD35510.1 oxidoreductase, putative [Thermotoga maritima MSB8]AGL49347.1 oxidoreductase, putative [Thermotoga maritima MSB8]AKE26355.1 oxidoreductase [Thermotoga maritima]AKE28219.1 oxidoreductase [Thermotoga maritima MSB8]AKE30093.1 oxidoreductase [Thermotoga maritima]